VAFAEQSGAQTPRRISADGFGAPLPIFDPWLGGVRLPTRCRMSRQVWQMFGHCRRMCPNTAVFAGLGRAGTAASPGTGQNASIAKRWGNE
jgi:hypothetical protein